VRVEELPAFDPDRVVLFEEPDEAGPGQLISVQRFSGKIHG
jgi:hypothetical protein